MNVHHALVTLGHKYFTLWNLKYVNFGLDKVSSWHHLFMPAENMAFLDVFVIGDFDL